MFRWILIRFIVKFMMVIGGEGRLDALKFKGFIK